VFLCDLADDMMRELAGSQYSEDMRAEASKVIELLSVYTSRAASSVCFLCACAVYSWNEFLSESHGNMFRIFCV